MTIKLNFIVEAWIKELAIEASSEKDAIEKLKSMSLADIMAAGAIADSSIKLSDVETEVASHSVTVQVSEIEYDFDSEDMDVNVIEYLKNLLPKTLKIELEDVTDSDDIEELIKDAILLETNYNTKSFEFQVLEDK